MLRKTIIAGLAVALAAQDSIKNFFGSIVIFADKPFECHLQMQTRRGICNLENLDLSQLVEDKAYEFLFEWAPLKIKGGTGSPGNPIALY